MEPRNRNILIFAVIALMMLLAAVLFLVFNNSSKIPESGGSGQPNAGTIILRNMDAPTNDQDAIPLGNFLTTDQQNTIRDQLQAILKLKKSLPLYNGSVTDGTVTVNYDTNDLAFTVHVVEFNTDYKIAINTVSNTLIIKDSNDKKVN